MSLNAREQQALDFIEQGLAGSDPALASLLDTFARLASGDAMPVHDAIRTPGWRDARGARRLYRRLGFHRAAVLLWLLIGVVLAATALAISQGSSRRACTTSLVPVCAAPTLAHSSHPAVPGRRPAQGSAPPGTARPPAASVAVPLIRYPGPHTGMKPSLLPSGAADIFRSPSGDHADLTQP